MARSFREIIELHLKWWDRKNEAPLVHVFAPTPKQKTLGGFDIDKSPEEILERKLAAARKSQDPTSDNLACAFVNFGTAFFPALAGAGYEYDGNTVWSHPCAQSAEELRVQPFDPEHELWTKYIVRFEKLLEGWSWESYLPGPTNTVGPMDTLAAMLGPELLSMELLMNPDAIKQAAMDAARLFIDVFDAQWKMLQKAGAPDGVVDWMHTWLPGKGHCYSEDYSALCSEAHFREFFLPPNHLIGSHLDTPYLHIHSGAAQCMPAILEMQNLKAIELSNDPNGPDIDGLIRTGRMIQAAGKCLQMSNWEHPLERDEIAEILRGLDPGGLKITLQAESRDEMQDLYDFAKSFRKE
ncbi:MAG: hypothetical protein ACLFUS_10055 [Candidatus Sumerlaeia bacterium]